MPTRIFFASGEQVTVSESPDAVAQKLAGGGFAELDRPWGDSSIYVNPASINYIESQDERAPDIAALEATPADATPQAPAAPAAPGMPAAGAPTPGMPTPGAPQPGTPGQYPAG
jgi:hypothetical protein